MKKNYSFFFMLLLSSHVMAQEIDILFGEKIPMRDGIKLNATVYKPHDLKETVPAIFELTPYISDSYHPRGNYFAKHDFVFVIVDVRGRGSSDGVFDPFMQEAYDGYDVVEWLAKQPWCNGKITMWGGSYAGYDQWATAKELPPHLSTIVPVASAKPGVDFPMSYNIFNSYIIRWLTYTSGKTGNSNLFNDDAYWRDKYTERYNKDIPFKKLDSLTGNASTIFQKWIAHPLVDNYIKSFNPSTAQYSQMKIPILTITGSYDGDQPGALSFYKEFMQQSSPEAKDKHYLIIGPWDHAGTRTPTKEVGGLTFGDSSMLDMNDLHMKWYNFVMRDSIKPSFLKNKVAYYITNKNKWKYASSLEEIGNEKINLYLNTDNSKANDVLHSAKLQTQIPIQSTPGEYIYDPLNKRFAALEQNPNSNFLTDQTQVYNLLNNGLVYHSTMFEKDTEVSGFFELKAYIESDVKDMDVEADIYEIKADGTSVFLTSEAIRARFRESLEKEKLLTPGEISLFHFSHFTFISRVIEKGSRLRLVITSPNSINVQKNYCSGTVVSEETAKDAHVAHIKVYNDTKHASVLLIPVMK
jgi:uncharacterized protein